MGLKRKAGLKPGNPPKRSPLKKKAVRREDLALLPTCLCGCGEETGFWEQTDRRRNRVKGEPKPFKPGHHARGVGGFAKPDRECDECGIAITKRSKSGLCGRCSCARVGRSNALPIPNCLHCGEPCPRAQTKWCSWPCYVAGREVPTGPEHHSWKGEEVGYWGARHRAQNAIEAHPCKQCGAPNADRHHIDRNIHNNDLGNIAFLCRSCHSRLHYEEDGPRGVVAVNIARGRGSG